MIIGGLGITIGIGLNTAIRFPPLWRYNPVLFLTNRLPLVIPEIIRLSLFMWQDFWMSEPGWFARKLPLLTAWYDIGRWLQPVTPILDVSMVVGTPLMFVPTRLKWKLPLNETGRKGTARLTGTNWATFFPLFESSHVLPLNWNAFALLNKLIYFISLLVAQVLLLLKNGAAGSLKAPCWSWNGSETELHPVNPIVPFPAEITIVGKLEFIGFRV
jgi:hypothetical protein